MATYSITGPDGTQYTIDGPEGATQDQVVRAIQRQQALQAAQLKAHEAKTGFVPALKAGARQFLAGAEEALGFEQAAEEQRQKAAATYEGMTDEDIARAKEAGILPTIGAYKTKYITEPLGGIVGRFGAPTLAGAVAPEAAIAGIGARALAFGAADLPASIGESMEAQRAAGQEVDPVKAIAAGLAKTTIATVGMPGVGNISKALGPKVLAEAEALAPRVAAGAITKEEALAQLSGRAKTYAQSMLANTVAGTGMMLGTEAVERFQTGQPQQTPEEMLETAGQAAILSPIFAALHPSGRREAEAKLTEAQKAREKEYADILASRYKLASLDEKAQIQRDLADAELQQRIRDRIHAEPNKSVQDIINEMTGVKKAQINKDRIDEFEQLGYITKEYADRLRKGEKISSEDIEAALKEPSGRYVSDPITGVERQLTVGELQKIQNPELFPEEPANIVTTKTLTDLGIKKSTPIVKKGGLAGLDLNKPEEAQQFIEGLSLFKEQPKLDPTVKLRIEAKLKEVQDKLKELEDERLRTERDRENIQVSRESLGGGAAGISEPIGARDIQSTVGLRSVEGGKEIRGAPLGKEGEIKFAKDEGYEQTNIGKSGNIYELKSIPEGQVGLGAFRSILSTPIEKGKELFRQLNSNQFNELFIANERNEARAADYYESFVANNKDLALGQDKNKNGIQVTFRPNTLSGRENVKPGTQGTLGNIVGKEYVTNAIAPKAIQSIFIPKEQVKAINPLVKRLLNERFDITKNEDGSYTFNRRTSTKVKEAKGEVTPGIGKNKLVTALKDRFGANINKAMQRGDVNVVSMEELAKTNPELHATIPADAQAFFHKGKAYLLHDRLTEQEAPRKLLHEVGAHFGLEGMIGKEAYRSILRELNRLKLVNKDVADAFTHVNNRYKELPEGSHGHLEEVLARLGESSPNHSIIRKVIAAIKTFLIKKGLWNPNKMDVRDIQDLINRSTERALAGKIKPVEEGMKAAREDQTKLPAFKRWFLGSKVKDENGNPKVVYHGTDRSFDAFISSETRNRLGNVEGFYFTESPEEASSYATTRLNRTAETVEKNQLVEGANVMPVYLNIGNPYNTKGKNYISRSMEKAYEKALTKQIIRESGYEDPEWVKSKVEELLEKGRLPYTGMDPKIEQEVIKAGGFDGMKDGPHWVAFDGAQIKSAIGNVGAFNRRVLNIRFAKAELPISERFNETKVFSPPGEDVERTLKEFATGSWEQFKTPEGKKELKDSANRAFIEGRMKVAYAGAGVQSKLIKDFNGAVLDATNNVRADILYDQALNGNILGSVSAKEGRVVFDGNGVAKVEPSPYHISAVFDELGSLAKKIGNNDAKHVASAYLQALRYKDILENNARLKTLIASTDNKKLKEQYKDQIKTVTAEQEAGVAPALRYGEEFPEVKKMAEIYDKVNRDEIDLLEKAGIYSKDYADKLRATKGYVPLYRVMDDLENATPGARQYFRGLADIGKQHAFEGSERQSLDVLDNMLTRHMWAINAAVRNNANRMLAKQLAIHGEDNKPIYHYKPTAEKADVMAPIWENGSRKYVEYTDPHFAQAVYGLEPSLGPILGFMGKASKALRIGVTATPTFQVYQLFNDAPRVAMLSGVNRPFKLMGEVFKSFYTALKDPNDPILKEMNRLGISGGYGHNAIEIADKMRRDLGLETNTLMKRALDTTESFAAASDMAQRRAVFKRTLLETGGTENADGSITGGNKVLAMDRAMNIIHWQKHGTSNKVRVLTQVVPFLNAYIQGMDTLIRAMRGEGISGMEKKQAQLLFAQTALKIAALSTIYSMVVAGDEEYQKLDDRQKIRSFIIPGTGIKIPVAAEVAMLTKAIPEMTWQYTVREGTANPMDSTKLMSAIGVSFADGLLGPNLMPQAFRAGIEVATNHDFLTGHPIVGRGLENLETSQQFTENTSELSKLIGKTGVISPVNLDHLLRGYGGTMASGVLYATDATANMFYNDKLPTTPIYRIPMISSFMYSPEGKGQLNDYYDLKNRSDEVAATLNHIVKFGTPEELQEYRLANKEMLSIRGQINAISNNMKNLREQRKRIIASNLSSDEKRAGIDQIDTRINNMVQNIGALRVKAGL